MPVAHDLEDVEGMGQADHVGLVPGPLGAMDEPDGELVVVLAGREDKVESGVTLVQGLLDVANAEGLHVKLLLHQWPEDWTAGLEYMCSTVNPKTK